MQAGQWFLGDPPPELSLQNTGIHFPKIKWQFLRVDSMVLYPVQIPPVPQASPFPGFTPKSSGISQLRVGTSCFPQVIPKNIERTHSSTRTSSQEISLFRVILWGKQAAKQATEKPHILCSMYPKVACNLQHTIFWWCLPLSPGRRPLCGGPIPIQCFIRGQVCPVRPC